MRIAICTLMTLFLLACPKRGERIAAFPPESTPLTQAGVSADGGAWKVTDNGTERTRLFVVQEGLCDACMLSYRARLRTENLQGRAFLEMWVHVPGKGDFFSKGFDKALRGTVAWEEIEVPFRLEEGQKPDVVRLNLVVEGGGTAWIRDIELWKIPL
jgi:hypothetical protein